MCIHAQLLQSCSTLCNPMECSARLPCPWVSPGKNNGVGHHGLLQGNLPDPEIDPWSSTLQVGSLPLSPWGNTPPHRYVLIAILYTVFCFFLQFFIIPLFFFDLFPCDLINTFSGMLGFLSFACVCVYLYRFGGLVTMRIIYSNLCIYT